MKFLNCFGEEKFAKKLNLLLWIGRDGRANLKKSIGTTFKINSTQVCLFSTRNEIYANLIMIIWEKLVFFYRRTLNKRTK